MFAAISSLRRHDPDQVLRVERQTLLSARRTDSPFSFIKKEYKRTGAYLSSAAFIPVLFLIF
jgi:hypothetical protein